MTLCGRGPECIFHIVSQVYKVVAVQHAGGPTKGHQLLMDALQFDCQLSMLLSTLLSKPNLHGTQSLVD